MTCRFIRAYVTIRAPAASLDIITSANDQHRTDAFARLDYYLDLDAKLIREANPYPMLH